SRRRSGPPGSASRGSAVAAWRSSGEERRGGIGVDPLPAERLQGGDQRVVTGQQRVRKAEIVELGAPAIANLSEARVLLEEIGAVEVATPVEVDFALAAESIDKVASELVRREDAGIGRQLGDFGCGGDRELIGRKSGPRIRRRK